ncbi:MAG: hypothetical protein NTY20_04680 [Candidatus Aenigmarchaeota archaeon]|nr:hypothetical protein [Candidatus Aenigmarchaeota archaeon]
MKIAICGSIDFTMKIKEINEALLGMGHKTELPFMTKKILNGEQSMEEFLKVKNEEGDFSFRKNAGVDMIKRYYNLIGGSDAILVVNPDKKGIRNYIGGNTLIEMAFAHVLGKKIFLLNGIPDMHYKDEIKAMQPVVLNGDLEKIK